MAYRGVASMLWIYMQYKRHEDLDGCLAEIAAAGYEGVEGWCDLHFGDDATAERVAAAVQKHGLQMCSAYSGGCLHDPAKAEATIASVLAAADRARRLDIGFRGVSCNPEAVRKSDSELAVQCANLERLGAALAERGLFLGIHNHTPEIREAARELRAALAETEPAHVGLCLDVEWVRRGGLDPIGFLKECSNRVRTLHLRQSHDGVWAEDFGEGDIDYRRVHALLQQTGFDGWLIVENSHEEATRAARPLADVQQASRKYVREVFGV